jgi:hypothetical protein
MPTVLSHRVKVATQVFLAVLMLFVGSGIYLLFRSKSLYIYKWCAVLGLSDNINYLRYAVSDWSISDFVKYSLPDGLYCAAYVLVMDAIWHKECGCVKFVAIFLVPFVTIISEALQYFGIVRGTYDYCDLVCYAIPSIFYLHYKKMN